MVSLAIITLLPHHALAWGREGHEIVALVARSYLTPQVREKVDALLATDTDPLAAHDMASESYWADEYREHGHGNTGKWHYVDLELSAPDLQAACYGFPPGADPPYLGAENNCIVDKIEEFERDLARPDEPQTRRLVDLKWLLHLVGDIHQPLHAADNYDRGGNCVRIMVEGDRSVKLHAYWDVDVVRALGDDPQAVADKLRAQITPAELVEWRKGGPREWATETYEVAKHTAYPPGSPAGCQKDQEPIDLPEGYEAATRVAAAQQLEKAGVRLASRLAADFSN